MTEICEHELIQPDKIKSTVEKRRSTAWYESDTCKIIADKTSSNEQERIFRAGFSLKSLKYSSLDTYYLVIADESGLQAPQRIEFQIDIAFAVDEFDFF